MRNDEIRRSLKHGLTQINGLSGVISHRVEEEADSGLEDRSLDVGDKQIEQVSGPMRLGVKEKSETRAVANGDFDPNIRNRSNIENAIRDPSASSKDVATCRNTTSWNRGIYIGEIRRICETNGTRNGEIVRTQMVTEIIRAVMVRRHYVWVGW